MQIRVRRTLKGHALQASIMKRHGTLEVLRKKAAKGDPFAKDDLWNLGLFEEDPTRLELDTTIEDIIQVDEHDLTKLTATRLQLVEVLKGLGEVSVKELTAAVGRDKKNVSEDIRILERYGIVQSHRHGKEKRLMAVADEIAFAF